MAATPAALWSQRNKGENTTLEATSAAAKKEESAGGARQDALVAPHRRGERRGERRRRGGEEERREGAKRSHLQKDRLERPHQEVAARSTVIEHKAQHLGQSAAARLSTRAVHPAGRQGQVVSRMQLAWLHMQLAWLLVGHYSSVFESGEERDADTAWAVSRSSTRDLDQTREKQMRN